MSSKIILMWVMTLYMMCMISSTLGTDGGWSEWGECEPQMRAGAGSLLKTRNCTNPPPSQDGAACTGLASMLCNPVISCADGVPMDRWDPMVETTVELRLDDDWTTIDHDEISRDDFALQLEYQLADALNISNDRVDVTSIAAGVFVKVSLRQYMDNEPPSGPWLAYQLQSLICNGDMATSSSSKLVLLDQYFTAAFPVVPVVKHEELPIISVGIISILGFLTLMVLLIKLKWVHSQPIEAFVALLAIADVVTDCNVAYILKDGINLESQFYACFAAIALPCLVNLMIVFYIIRQENRDADFSHWFRTNGMSAALLFGMGVLNVDAMSICTSALFHVPSLRAPFSERTRDLLKIFGFVTMLGEDLPQLAIQSTSLGLLPRHSSLVKMSLAISSLSILVGLFRRSWSCFIFCLQTRDVPKSQLQRLTAPNYDLALQDARSESIDDERRGAASSVGSSPLSDPHDYSERKISDSSPEARTPSISSTNEQRAHVEPVVRAGTFAMTASHEPDGAAEFADIRIA